MKVLALGVFVLAMFCVAPALAADGNVTAGTLAALGLGGMQPVSDAEGMQVRGAATATLSVRGTSLIFGQLIDPVTNSAAVFSSVNFADGTVSGATPLTITRTHSVTATGWSLIIITSPFSGVISGTVSGTGTVTAGP